MWLRDFLPGNTPSARILVYGYNSALVGSKTSVSGIKDFAYDFLQRILDDRPTDKVGTATTILAPDRRTSYELFSGKEKTHCIHMSFVGRNCSKAGKSSLPNLCVRGMALQTAQTEPFPRL